MKYIIFTIILIICLNLNGEIIKVSNNDFSVSVISSNDYSTIIQYKIGNFEKQKIRINDEIFNKIFLENEAHTYKKGYPELPKISRSIIIDNEKDVFVKLSEIQYVDLNISVIPSKGHIERNIDPDSIPFIFNNIYQKNELYPTENVTISEPYIMRDFRAVTVNFFPFSYNNINKKLRVIYSAKIEIINSEKKNKNIKIKKSQKINPAFSYIYENQFLNYNFNPSRYETIDERAGKMLIISYPDFMNSMQSFMEWKTKKGIPVEIYNVNDIGGAEEIKNFIKAEYDSDNQLTYVLLVGDSDEVPAYYDEGDSDAAYSLVEGLDSYPDIFIGRFSAENIDEVENQVEKVIFYERDLVDGDWLKKGIGIASGSTTQGDNNETDFEHIEIIRNKLLNFTYSEVDQIYESNGANADMVSEAINNGRSFINYCGHGTQTSWTTTGFSLYNIPNLQNENQFPFIISVACVNGAFVGHTCFAESWLRAENEDGNSTGAIAFYGSTINQSWDPPMAAQDEIIDLLMGNSSNGSMTTLGGLCYNGSAKMMDKYNSDGIKMFKTWVIFGDPSLQVRTTIPEDISIEYDPILFLGMDTMEIITDSPNILISLNYDGEIYASGYTNESGSINLELDNLPEQDIILDLTASGFNKKTYTDEIPLIPNSGPYFVVRELIPQTENAILRFNSESFISLKLENIGTIKGENLLISLSENDNFIDIIDGNFETQTVLPSEEILFEDAFKILITDDIPDQHQIEFNISITDGNEVWEDSFVLEVEAPKLFIDEMIINDENGLYINNMLDSGESVTLNFPIKNIGHVNSLDFSVFLNSDDERISVSEGNINCQSLFIGEEIVVSFTILVSENFTSGEEVSFNLNLQSGDYTKDNIFTTFVGLITEGFEEDFAYLLWQNDGYNFWSVIDSLSYENNYCAQSGSIGNNESSSLQLDINVINEGKISFYRKVSCEAKWDSLQFIVDENIITGWSGELDWEKFEFPISQGEHSLEWKYVKDGSTVEGLDCSWIDFIVFPPTANIINPEHKIPSQIDKTKLIGNFPNPFNNGTKIQYEIGVGTNVNISIYNVKGQIVKEIINELHLPNKYIKEWNGKNNQGKFVSSGIYFCRFKTQKKEQIMKMLFLK